MSKTVKAANGALMEHTTRLVEILSGEAESPAFRKVCRRILTPEYTREGMRVSDELARQGLTHAEFVCEGISMALSALLEELPEGRERDRIAHSICFVMKNMGTLRTGD